MQEEAFSRRECSRQLNILDKLKEHLVAKNVANPDLVLVQVMGMLSPSPSYVGHKVLDLEKEEPGKGLDYLHDLSIKNNYIQKTAIDKNLKWSNIRQLLLLNQVTTQGDFNVIQDENTQSRYFILPLLFYYSYL